MNTLEVDRPIVYDVQKPKPVMDYAKPRKKRT